MSKSILTILIIGIVGAILMSFVMKHLVELTTERERSPFAPAVEMRLGSKLIGSVRITKERAAKTQSSNQPSQVQLVVHGRVLAGLDKRRLAEDAGREVWFGSMRAGETPSAVRVVLDDDDGGKACEFDIAKPRVRR